MKTKSLTLTPEICFTNLTHNVLCKEMTIANLTPYPFTPQILILTHQHLTTFENIAGKGEIARNKQFLFFPQCFLLNQIFVSPFVHNFDILSVFAAELEDPKIAISGKGLQLHNP